MHNYLIQVRPGISDGLWLGLLLPISITVSLIKYNAAISWSYQQCFLLTLGILFSTIIFIFKYTKNKNVYINNRYFMIPAFIFILIFYMFSNKGIVFCSYSGVMSTLAFYKIYLFILKTFPLSFTFGEALLCAQSVTIFLYSVTISIYQSINIPPKTSLQIGTFIIQIGLLCIALICYLAYRYQYFRTMKQFYAMSLIVIIFLLYLPLHMLLRVNPLFWIFKLCTKDIPTMTLFLYWVICSTIATYIVSKQIKEAQKASTVIRKTFHILAVLVFLPGLLYQCSIIYLASGVTLGIFIALELLRNLNIPPLGILLQDGFIVFSDEKDVGAVALTPIYLLVGCSLPLWLHPAPCDLTDSTGFNLLPLLSGLLSVGIGDTLASFVGTWIGKHKWSGTNKTIEGTIGCILGQLLAVYLLFYFGYTNFQQYNLTKILIGIITVALVEAKTDQVDNLILPLVMYTILL